MRVRIAVVCAVAGLGLAADGLWAEDAAALPPRPGTVSVAVTNLPPGDLLAMLPRLAGVEFVHVGEFRKSLPVTFAAVDRPWREVLDICLVRTDLVAIDATSLRHPGRRPVLILVPPNEGAALRQRLARRPAAEPVRDPTKLRTQSVSLTLEQVPLQDVIGMFVRLSGAEISGPKPLATERVSVNISHLHWRDALDIILAPAGFEAIEKEAGVLVVRRAPADE